MQPGTVARARRRCGRRGRLFQGGERITQPAQPALIDQRQDAADESRDDGAKDEHGRERRHIEIDSTRREPVGHELPGGAGAGGKGGARQAAHKSMPQRGPHGHGSRV